MDTVSANPPGKARKSRAIMLLVMAAVGALLFTSACGLFVLQSTHHFDNSNEWVEHTHAVIDLLMQQSTRIDRTEASLQLYRATSDEDNLRFAATSLVSLNTGILRLQDLVSDNPSQTAHAQALARALQALSQTVDKSQQARTVPSSELRDCHNKINLMMNEERGLLEQRTKESRRTLLRSYISGTVYLGVSLVLLMAVFGALIHDTFKREASEIGLSLVNSDLAASVEKLRVRVSEGALLKNARDELLLCINAGQAYDCLASHMERAVPSKQRRNDDHQQLAQHAGQQFDVERSHGDSRRFRRVGLLRTEGRPAAMAEGGRIGDPLRPLCGHAPGELHLHPSVRAGRDAGLPLRGLADGRGCEDRGGEAHDPL